MAERGNEFADRLFEYLNSERDLQAEANRELLTGVTETVTLAHLRAMRELVLREGNPFPFKPLPRHFSWGDTGSCYQDSMLLAIRNGLIYVEGFALVAQASMALPHAWCVDSEGYVCDCTWHDKGLAYFGVMFNADFVRSKHAAFEQMPLGTTTGSLLNDPTDQWAILEGSAVNWKHR